MKKTHPSRAHEVSGYSRRRAWATVLARRASMPPAALDPPSARIAPDRQPVEHLVLVLRVLQRRLAEAHVDLKKIPELVSTVLGVDQIPRNILLRFGRAISRRSSGAALIPEWKWHCESKMHLNSTQVVRSCGTTFLTLTLFLHP